MKVFMAVITTLSVPLVALNLLGGAVSGIWLAVIGDWHAVGLGVLCLVVSASTMDFALIPTMLFAAPAIAFAQRGKTFGLLCFSFLSSLYTLGLVTAWCCGILLLFVRDSTQSNLIPRLIWSYGVATAPWAYLASKGGPGSENVASMVATFLAEVGYIVVVLLVLLSSITFLGVIGVFGAFMGAALGIQLMVTVTLLKAQRAMLERTGWAD